MSHTADEEALLVARAEVPSCERFIHLLSHSFGPAPRAVRRVLVEYAEGWDTLAMGVWEQWLPALRAFGSTIERVLDAPPGSVGPTTSCSSATAIIASAFD